MSIKIVRIREYIRIEISNFMKNVKDRNSKIVRKMCFKGCTRNSPSTCQANYCSKSEDISFYVSDSSCSKDLF
jgi:hypothetical protein